MSDLPATNREVALEWIEHARAYREIVAHAQGRGGNKVAVQALVSAAEMALKAVYISHETYFPRTRDIRELIEGCPDASIGQLLRGYPGEFIDEFSINYQAPYMRGEPLPTEELDDSCDFAEQIIAWATTAVTRQNP